MDDPQEKTVYQAFVDHGATLSSLLVDGLQSSGASAVLSNSDNPSAPTKMSGGVIQNARLELDGNGLLVDGTELTGPQAAIDITSSIPRCRTSSSPDQSRRSLIPNGLAVARHQQHPPLQHQLPRLQRRL